MTDSADESHVRQLLGPYLLGALDSRDRETVEHHLAVCPACLAESDELGEAVAMLALLSEEDGRGIVEEFGAPRLPARDPAAVPVVVAEVARSGNAVVEVARSVADGPVPDAAPPGRTPAGGARPAHRRPPSAPPSRPETRRRVRAKGLLGIAGPVLVVLVSAVLFVGLAGEGEDGGGSRTAPVDVTLAATAAAASTDGAALSVAAAGADGSVTVRATVTGLKPGVRYQLHVVSTDGATHQVATWAGSADAREVTGEAPVPVSALSFFAVTRTDGTPVVSAYVKVAAPPSR